MAKKRAESKRTKAKRKSYSVFVSHATHDKFVAKILCEKIEQLGAKTFRDDRDIEGGDSIPKMIRERMRECDELVVVMTPVSIKRQWVLLEIGIALGMERRIVPLFYQIATDDVPAIIRDNRGFDLNHVEDYLEDLQKRVNKR